MLDTWFEREVKPRLRGSAELIRYADDFVILLSREVDARRVMDVLPKRFGRYGLTLHPGKTRLLDFRRPTRSSGEGGSRPGTFDLLGFTHYWGKSRRGKWVVKRKTAKDRKSRSLRSINQAFAAIDAASSCDLPTLVCGETGTGKELAARAIHRRSPRRASPFVVLDCSTLPAGLAESAILGHRKGAFTGADEDRRGAFEEASGGTLFLDEIGELPLELQVKLLRVVDRGEVVRVGENDPRAVDVRIIAATHRDLLRMVDDGRFRQDLYYRLGGLVIEMPSLRDRGGDEIAYLANAFLSEHAAKLQRSLTWSPAAIEALEGHPWPGNVRELSAVVARAVALRGGDSIEPADLSLRVDPTRSTRLEESARLRSYDEAHADLDRALLPRILAECGGDLDEAAMRLGRPARALVQRMHALGIYAPES